MNVIYQADQYCIPFKITRDGELITPDNVDAIRIGIGNVVQTYPGKLTCDGKENWLFYLESASSSRMNGNTRGQVEIKVGNVRQHSPTFAVNVKESMLRGGWA